MREVRGVRKNKRRRVTAVRGKRNVQYEPYVFPAKLYYEKEYLSWNAGQKKKALNSLKFFGALKKWYDGWDIAEIAFSMDMSYGRVQQALKGTESRVINYIKLEVENESV